MVTLYDCSTAPSPRRARILLAEKGVAHDTVQIDLRHGEQLGEAYRRINPQCTVPALRTDDGLLLTDNAAITAYLEARYPDPPLFGTTPPEKAEIASWNWRIEFEGLLAIAEAERLKREVRYEPVKPWDVASTSPPSDQPAEAPPELVTPSTARAASSVLSAISVISAAEGIVASSTSRFGKARANRSWSASPV